MIGATHDWAQYCTAGTICNLKYVLHCTVLPLAVLVVPVGANKVMAMYCTVGT